MKQKLMSFENKVLKIICGTVYDNDLGCWRRRKNKETQKFIGIPRIANFVKAQRIQWFEHVRRRSNSEYLKAAAE
jgi:hypothetical protein